MPLRSGQFALRHLLAATLLLCIFLGLTRVHIGVAILCIGVAILCSGIALIGSVLAWKVSKTSRALIVGAIVAHIYAVLGGLCSLIIVLVLFDGEESVLTLLIACVVTTAFVILGAVLAGVSERQESL